MSSMYEFQGISYPLIDEESVNGVKLYPHQRISVYNLEETERTMKLQKLAGVYVNTRTAIFGDHPGYGKTFSLCSLIKRDRLQYNPNIFVAEGVNVMRRISSIYPIHMEVLKTTLLIVPLGIVNQWKASLDMFNLRTIIINKKSLIETDIRQYDVVMVTSTMYKHFYDKTSSNMIMYKRMIFDEPDSTHIPGFCKLNSLFSWYVTGTPRRLISARLSRGHHIYDWIKRYNLSENIDRYVIRNSVNLIESSIQLPPITEIEYEITYTRMQNLAMRHVDNSIREAIVNGDMNNAAKLMGWDGEGDITTCIIRKYKIRIENLEYEKSGIEMRRRQIGDKQYLMCRLKELDTRIQSMKDCIKEVDNEKQNIINADCSICMEKCHKPVMTMCCNTVTCQACLVQWMNSGVHKNCHMCRSTITSDMVVNLKNTDECKEDSNKDGDDEEKKEESVYKPKSKRSTIEDIILKGGSEKRWIIFSNSVWSFESLGSSILKNLIYEELKGSTSSIENILKRFKIGKTKIILVNNDHNCAGINIIDATDVIIHDSSSIDQELQCIKRAHRMGREKPLTVHRFKSD